MTEHDDRRMSPRRKIIRAAISSFDGPQSPIPCVLLDLSESGAKLNVHCADDLPDEFSLMVETELLQKRCRIVWRRGEEVGVQFVS